MTSWAKWNYGKEAAEMTDDEVRRHASRAWNANDGDVLRMMRAEGARRGITVA